MFLTKAVPVPCGLRAVVARSVRFDGQHHTSRLFGMSGGEVDSATGHPVLGNDPYARFLQGLQYVVLKGVEVNSGCLTRSGQVGAEPGVLQICPQQASTGGAQFLRVHVIVRKGADHGHPPPCAGHGHIEPSFPAVEVEWTESVGETAVDPLGVADAQNDRIAFVALDPFDVLHEERTPDAVRVFGEEAGEIRTPGAGGSQLGIDPLRLLITHGDDTQAFGRALLGVAQHQVDNRLDLLGCRGLLARGQPPVDQDVLDGRPGQHTGKSDQIIVVDVDVGKRDESFVLAAVVPLQSSAGQ